MKTTIRLPKRILLEIADWASRDTHVTCYVDDRTAKYGPLVISVTGTGTIVSATKEQDTEDPNQCTVIIEVPQKEKAKKKPKARMRKKELEQVVVDLEERISELEARLKDEDEKESLKQQAAFDVLKKKDK